MGFKTRKKRKFKKAKEFVMRIEDIHKKVEAALKRVRKR